MNRRYLMMIANALLYFGPLLAGLGGFGWGYVPVFTAIFVLWLIILQPMEFPITKREWLSADAWVAVCARGAVQLLFVVILFSIGRGIGGVLGAMTGYPPMLPIAISFLSIPIARILWNPWAQPPVPVADSSLEGLSDPASNVPAELELAPKPRQT